LGGICILHKQYANHNNKWDCICDEFRPTDIDDHIQQEIKSAVAISCFWLAKAVE
jgi:hypothetical protein